ncbi:MAG: DUF3108 domain-containing protein [Gammaproteobacteria bacterium]|nr:DUF3108 domain-containing protein [Gammaproteobacteria bacterium]
MKRLYSLLLAFTLLPPAVTNAEHFPPAFSAEYDVKKGFLKVGEASRHLKVFSKNKVEYTSVSKTTGLVGALLGDHITQTTMLEYAEGRPRPLIYHYRRTGRENYEVNQKYDWNKKHVYIQVDKDKLSYDFPPGSQDQSSYQLALMIDLAHGKRNFDYHIAENRRLKTYHIKHLRDETVDSIYGDLKTVVISHEDNKGNRTTLWCAEDLFFLPVKIEHRENGISFTAYLTRTSGFQIKTKSKKFLEDFWNI